jgi:tetratricopeptide (TPR) repeat protein
MRKKTSSMTGARDRQPEALLPPSVSIEDACRLHERAMALREPGQHAEAATYARHALTAFEHECGPDHPDVAMTLSNLAVLYVSLGQYTDAEPLYQRALALFEPALGPTHPHVRTCLRNYARLLRDTQRRAEARALEARARQARLRRREHS